MQAIENNNVGNQKCKKICNKICDIICVIIFVVVSFYYIVDAIIYPINSNISASLDHVNRLNHNQLDLTLYVGVLLMWGGLIIYSVLALLPIIFAILVFYVIYRNFIKN